MTYEILQEPTWGSADWGGDSRGVAAQLSSGVQTVVGSSWAFAAVKVDGSVVTWGVATVGGDSRGVAEQVSTGVQTVVGWRAAVSVKIFKMVNAFARFAFRA